MRWVHVSELLDPSPYLLGGELILSAGVWRPRGRRVDMFIDALSRSDTAALGWGLLEDDATVPPAVVQACERARLTLFAVPTSTPFIAISQRFVDRLQEEREAAMRATIERNDRLVRALSAGSNAPSRILGVLREAIQRDVWVGTASGRTLAGLSTSSSVTHAQLVEALRAAGAASQGRRAPAGPPPPVTLFPIATATGSTAFLVVDGTEDSLSRDDRSTIGQALPLLGFAIARVRDAEQAERRLAAELVDVVLAGQTDFAAARLSAYGLDPHGPLTGAAVRTAQPATALAHVQRALDRLGLDGVVALHGDELAAIVQTRAGFEPDTLGERLLAAVGSGSAVGIGSEARGVDGLRRSMIQAREAAALAARGQPVTGWARYDQISSHGLLLALQDAEVLQAFRDGLLGRLEEHDARRHTNLVGTLDRFLGSGGQWRQTADALHIHVNTLRHRLARCEELTGRSLASMADRVDLYIALRARQDAHARP